MSMRIIQTRQSRRNFRSALNAERIFLIGLRKALYDIGLDATRAAIDSINNSGRTGRVYRIRGNIHVASAPGEPPANLTGKLRRSLNYRVRGVDEVEWGSLISYGQFLEEGTRRMRKRPFLTPVHKVRGSHHKKLLQIWVRDEIKRRR